MCELLGPGVEKGDSPSDRSQRLLKISFMEVYNEEIFDLLSPTRVPLKVKPGFAGGRKNMFILFLSFSFFLLFACLSLSLFLSLMPFLIL